MTRRAAGLLVLLAILAIVSPWLAPHDPQRSHDNYLFAPPMPLHVVHDHSLQVPFAYPVVLTNRMAQRYDVDRSRTLALPWFDRSADPPVFLLGADSFGRDLLSRLLHGTRVSVGLALIAVLGALSIGALLGGIAGMRAGWLDQAVTRLSDFVLVLPVIYVVLILRALMPLNLSDTQVFTLMAAIFIAVGWPFAARGVRAIVVAEREQEYVLAARSLGANGFQILWRHLLPACTGNLVVQATLLLPAFILAEATLSYAGLGFDEALPTWGTMLSAASNVNDVSRFPWTLAPAAAIFVVVLMANTVLRSSDRAIRVN